MPNCHNNISCPCTKDYPRHGHCCAWIVALVCLIAGLAIYAFGRNHIYALELFGWSGQFFSTTDRPVLGILIYNLPDALWYMALLVIQWSYTNRQSFISRVMFVLSIIFPFALEGMQALGWVAGTADILDIVAYSITLTLFILIFMKKNKHLFPIAQVVILVAFGFMAIGSSTYTPVAPTVKVPVTMRAEVNSVDQKAGQYVYIGTFSSSSDAEMACRELGYNEYKYENGKGYAKIK